MQKTLGCFVLCGVLFCAEARAAGVPDVGDMWHNLSALPAHSEMHVASDEGGSKCYLIGVDEQALTCGRKDGGAKGRHVYARASVKTVKLTRYGISTLAGAGIGAGAGAIAGFSTTQNPQGWFNGAVRGVFTGLGAGIGALAFGPGDVFRGPTVYRRMAKGQ